MLILGIESTCDETAAAVVRDGVEILSNVVASQLELHRPFGGVVPEIACRRHLEQISLVIRKALHEAKICPFDLDLIAVAQEPGLIGALLVGIHTAQGLSLALERPLIPINHVEAHLYAAIMSQPEAVTFPALGVVISGGHTALFRMEALGRYILLGATVDDAIGEAFDKVATLLNLPYPGGPEIEKLARQAPTSPSFHFSAGHVKGRPLDFSFSGLKTAVLYTLKGPKAHRDSPILLSPAQFPALAAAFQEAALGDIVAKSVKAASQFECRSILFGGGVANNKRLRTLFANATSLPLLWPAAGLTLDNAAMIAGLAFHRSPGKSAFEKFPTAQKSQRLRTK